MRRFYLLIFFSGIICHCIAQADAGPDRTICLGSSVEIGKMANDPTKCFSWKANPADAAVANAKTPKVTVSPTQTTTYTLTVIGQDFSTVNTDDVTIAVIQDGTFTSSSVTVASGATPSMALGSGVWGFTYPENVQVEISACSNGSTWHAVVTSIRGNYSEQVRLLPGVQEVTGPGGNTSQSNFCNQVGDLKALSLNYGSWYKISAITAHEDVHATRFKPALETVANQIEALFEALSVTDNGQTQQSAINQIKALGAYTTAKNQSQQLWLADILIKVANDHQGGAGPTYVAEHGVVDPVIATICTYATSHSWAVCSNCP